MATIADFLKSIGMSEFAAGLSDIGFDPLNLHQITEAQLERLGIGADDLSRLLRAISQARPPTPPPEAPERRHLTIMFCDLVGSTSLSTRLDPETLHDIIAAYRAACVARIEAANGFVAKYVGDGLLAYFGYPRAAEDDAERAVAAALEIVANVGEILNDQGEPLQTRVGVASGLVLVGDLIAAGSAHGHDVVGETPNLAARLQAHAEPGQVLIAAETRSLVGTLFEYSAVGPTSLKGFSAPVEIWRVVGHNEAHDRFQALRTVNTRLIGREAEAERLYEAWRRASAGAGEVVLISGKAGIGKSRLAQSLVDRLGDEAYVHVRFSCMPNRQASPLFPFINQVRIAAGVKRDDASGERLDKLEALLGRAGVSEGDAAPLLADLLSIPVADRYKPLDLTPQRRRARIMATLLSLLEGLAREPALILFEDAHWLDPSSLELLSQGVARARALPALFVISYRPEFVAPWRGEPGVQEIALSPLSHDQTAELVANLVASGRLPSLTVQEIVQRTEGVPLFVEELTKTLSGRGALPRTREVPVTLQDMLTSRLDLLGQAKQVAQVASVLGSEFSARLLGQVIGFDEPRLKAELAKLTKAEIIVPPGEQSAGAYRFRHALLQEAAYQMLSRAPRREYHFRAAEAIETLQPDIAAAQPEIVAHHYAQADRKAQAIEHWRAAGDKAILRSANLEAINHYARALEALATTPDGPQKLQAELALLLAQGTPLIATRGFAAPEVGAAYARAREICAMFGNPPQLFPVLWGLWVFYTARADHLTADELATQCQVIAQAAGDGSLVMLSHHAKGVTLSALGDHAAAVGELEAAVALYDRQGHAPLAFLYGQDSGVVCRSQAAFALYFLGRTEEALKLNREAIELARALSHPYSLAAALVFSAWLHQLKQDRAAILRDADAAMAISQTHDFPFWLLTGMILRGWALMEGKTFADGFALMQQGVASYCATGAGIMRPYYLGLVAAAQAQAGDAAGAFASLDDADAAVRATSESWFEPELCRLRGELLRREATPESVEAAKACFEAAQAIAARQGSRVLLDRARASAAGQPF